MNALTKWNPFRELEEIQNRLGSLFGRTPMRGLGEEAMTVSEWTPLVDITEDDKEYLIKAELPEVKKEDVKVTVENGTLTITGERKFEKEEKDKKYHRINAPMDRSCGVLPFPKAPLAKRSAPTSRMVCSKCNCRKAQRQSQNQSTLRLVETKARQRA